MKSKSIIKMSILLSGILAISMYGKQQIKKNSIVLTEASYQYEKGNDWDDRWRGVDIEVHYPQIQSGSDADNITNNALRNAAFSFFDDIVVHEGAIYMKELTYEEVLHQFEAESQNPMTIDIATVEYKVLQCTTDYVSIIFSAEAGNGASVYSTQYVATIDVKTGQYVHIQDILDTEELMHILADNHFEVCVGTYSEVHEEDVRETENIVRYIGTFAEMYNKKTGQSDWHPVQHTAVDQHYDSQSCENIGMDTEGLYIYFLDDMAFEEYFIFKISWKYIDYKERREKEAEVFMQ